VPWAASEKSFSWGISRCHFCEPVLKKQKRSVS
jgi:hypothetical protein